MGRINLVEVEIIIVNKISELLETIREGIAGFQDGLDKRKGHLFWKRFRQNCMRKRV